MASATKQSKPVEAGDIKEVQAVIEKVDQLQGEIDKLNEQASDEILKVEQKYNKQRQPHFQKRSDLLAQIPHFWITVFINHPQIGSLMTEDDEEILQHLTKLEVQEFDDIKSGYKITLHFEKNPYFKNETIVKEFKMNDAGQTSTKSSPVDWFPGKNILAKGAKKDKDQANKGERKRKHDDESSTSLMRWFLADQIGEEMFGEADELAELIKDEVWPNPLQFYLASDDDDDDDEAGILGVEGADVVDDDDDVEEGLDDDDADGDADDDVEGGDEDGEEDGE